MKNFWKKVLLSFIVTASFINPAQSRCMMQRLKQFFGPSQEEIIAGNELKSNNRNERYKVLYELLSMMPPEMIRMILDYESREIKGISVPMDEKSLHEYLNAPILSAPMRCIFKQLHPVNVDHEIIVWEPVRWIYKPLKVKEDGKVISFNNKRLVWCSSFGKIILIDPNGKPCSLKLLKNSEHDCIMHIGKIADNILVADTMSNDCKKSEIQFWDIDQETLLFKQSTESIINDFTQLTDHVFAATSGEVNDNIEIWYWDATTKKARRIRKFELHIPITSLAKLDAGSLAASLKSGGIRIQDPCNGNFIRTLGDHEAPVGAMMQLPDGRLVSKAYNDETKVWS